MIARVQRAFAERFGLAGLLAYVTPDWRVLVLAVVLMMGESAIALANPWIASRLTALVTQPAGPAEVGGQVPRSALAQEGGLTANGTQGLHPPHPNPLLLGGEGDKQLSDGVGLLGLMTLWALLLAAQSGLSFGNRYLLGSTGAAMLADLRSRLDDHLQSLPLSYFHERRRGDVLALLGNDAAHISHFVVGTLVSLLPLLMTFAGAAYFLFRISPAIAAMAAVLIPLFFLAMKLIGRRIRPLSSESMRLHAEMFATLEENIGMLPAIKSFTREVHESARFQRSNVKLLRVVKRQLLVESILSPVVHLLAGLGLLLLLYVSTLQVQSGVLQPSDMVSVLLYGMLLTRPVSGLAGVYGSVQTARGAAVRLLEAFAVWPEPDDAGASPLAPIAGHIRLEDLHFGYPGRQKIFVGVNLEIQAGETVAITGENGSGKSTIIHLLMRFADPAEGRVLVDGVDVRGVSIASLRSQIGLVAQHVLLLNGTVRQNIAYGRPDADQGEIEAAARSAQADAFIRHLPQGYETLIGDQGIRLSGGQRQRIALARALLKAPPILILDEATAMFDPEGELAFIEQCQTVLAERTVILITHRPASLALADRVLVLKQGLIA